MAEPITWRNINSQPTAAAQLFAGADRSFEKASDIFSGLLDKNTERERRNQQTIRDNNTQAYLDQLSQYRTPEELQAAIDTGAVDQLRLQYGRNIDRNLARGAAESQLTNLRQAITAKNTYDDAATDRAQRGDVDQIKQLIARGDFVGAEKRLGEVDLRNEASLYEALTSGKNAVEDRGFTRDQRNQTRTQWGRENEAYNTQQGVNAATNQALADHQATLAKQESDYLALADKYQIPRDKQGNLDFASAPPGAIQAFSSAVSGLGLDKVESDTEVLRKMQLQVGQNFPNASPELLDKARATVAGRLSSYDELAPTDQAEVALQVNNAKQALEMDSNPYYKEQDFNPAEGANTVVSQMMKNNPDFVDLFDDQSTRADIVQKFTKALTDGVLIEGKRIPVTPAILESAAMGYGYNWFEFNDKDIGDVIEDYVTNSGVDKQYENFTEFKKFESGAITAKKAQVGADTGTKLNARLARLRGALQ